METAIWDHNVAKSRTTLNLPYITPTLEPDTPITGFPICGNSHTIYRATYLAIYNIYAYICISPYYLHIHIYVWTQNEGFKALYDMGTPVGRAPLSSRQRSSGSSRPPPCPVPFVSIVQRRSYDPLVWALNSESL